MAKSLVNPENPALDSTQVAEFDTEEHLSSIDSRAA